LSYWVDEVLFNNLANFTQSIFCLVFAKKQGNRSNVTGHIKQNTRFWVLSF